jgi:RNA 3'-terminal phosphate cyclase
MAEAARGVLATAGYQAEIEAQEDTRALQPGAALALFADLAGGTRLGADQAGAPRRRAEAIGQSVAQQLVEDLRTGATLDRYAADQLIPFAALAVGESRFRIPQRTEHMESNAWLAHALSNRSEKGAAYGTSIVGLSQ